MLHSLDDYDGKSSIFFFSQKMLDKILCLPTNSYLSPYTRDKHAHHCIAPTLKRHVSHLKSEGEENKKMIRFFARQGWDDQTHNSTSLYG